MVTEELKAQIIDSVFSKFTYNSSTDMLSMQTRYDDVCYRMCMRDIEVVRVYRKQYNAVARLDVDVDAVYVNICTKGGNKIEIVGSIIGIESHKDIDTDDIITIMFDLFGFGCDDAAQPFPTNILAPTRSRHDSPSSMV